MKTTLAVIVGAVLLSMAAFWFGFRGEDVPQRVETPAKASAKPKVKLPTTPVLGTKDPDSLSVASALAARITADARTRCQQIMGITDATQRKLAFEKLLAETTDLAGLRGILETLLAFRSGGRDIGTEWAGFWGILSNRDPKGTVALIETYGPREKWYAEAVGMAVREWAVLDPQSAILWLQGNQALTGEDLDRATLSLIEGYASRDLAAATAYVLGILEPNDPLFQSMSQTLTQKALQTGGAEGLVSWFSQLPSDAARRLFFRDVTARLGEVSPEAQQNWLANNAGSAFRDDQMYVDYINALVKDQPQAAMEYAMKLPRSAESGTYVGIGDAASEWLVMNPDEFVSYFNRLRSPQTRQVIAESIQAMLNDPNLPPQKRDLAVKFLQSLTQ